MNAPVLSVVENVLMNGILVYRSCSENAPSADVKEALTKPVVLKGFDKLLQQIQNLKDSTSSDDSDSGGAQSEDALPNVNLS